MHAHGVEVFDRADVFKKGQSCLNQTDYDGAIASFTEAIRLDRRSAEAHFNRGLAYAAKSKTETIEKKLSQPAQIEFVETPLKDVVDYLKDLHKIEIPLRH